MPKKAEELGPLAVSRLNTPGLHFVGGVAGLALQVLPSGGRSWVLRVTVGSKRRDMGLGGFPDVTLAGARDSARDARLKISKGIDPIDEMKRARHLLKLEQANAVTFEQAAKLYIDIHEPSWHNAKHTQQWRNSLANYAHPLIGQMLVRDIETRHVLEVLEPVWRSKTETATRVRSRIESVLNWCTTKGYRDGLNPARWKGHLENLLPKPGKVAKEEHFPALPIELAGSFMSALRDHHGSGSRALEFAVLTACRSDEVRGAVWGEFDLDTAEWVIPAERMKMKQEHRVPLSESALALVRSQLVAHQESTGLDKPAKNDIVFTAPRGGSLSNGTLNAVIKRMVEVDARWKDPKTDRTVVQHGFRSTFRDWVSERTSYPNDVAEMALAHTIPNKVEAAYRRGDLFEKRRCLMSDWAAFLAKAEKPAQVIDLMSKRG